MIRSKVSLIEIILSKADHALTECIITDEIISSSQHDKEYSDSRVSCFHDDVPFAGRCALVFPAPWAPAAEPFE